MDVSPLVRRALSTKASPSDSTAATTAATASHGDTPPQPSPEPRADDTSSLYRDQNDTWVDRHVPPKIRPYAKLARIDRPVGTWLLLWPCWWSIALAAPAGALPDLRMLVTFGIGALIMRGAGCTINDMWDRDFDGQVARTTQRPLAAGTITMFQAWQFLGLQLTAGLSVLLTLNNYSIVLGAASMGLVIAYPLMKRYTYFPQVVLGMTFNWGALLGWSAVQGAAAWPVVLPLYAAGVAWTLVYDTLYAHQDKDDDAALGLKSTALYFGNDRTVPALTALSVVSGSLLAVSGAAAGMAWPYYAGVAAATGHMLWQVRSADLSDRLNLTARFVSNKWVGAFVFAGAVAAKLVA